MAQRSTSIKLSKPRKKLLAQPQLRILELGTIPYSEAWEIQKELVEQRAADKIPDTLLLLEHPSVVTCGRGTKLPPKLEIPVFEIERGGEETLHSPGQIVGYPIMKLAPGNRDLHAYLRRVEEVLIRTLADFGIEADRREGLTGVWVGARKIASIGVACRKWVTYHGFALNVRNDLSLFQKIRPCGLDPAVMTSIAKELGCAPSLKAVQGRIVERFAAEFSTPSV